MIEYKDILKALKAPFPNGTVKINEHNQKAYIPNQVYTDRLEAATEGRWSKTVKATEINIEKGYVMAIVTVTICGESRDGIHLADISSQGVSNALKRAVSGAFVEALDTWEMGWTTLAPYYKNEWGSSPALTHLIESSKTEDTKKVVQSLEKQRRCCIFANCGKVLTDDEWQLLAQIPNLNREKMTYCFEHIPKHLKRKLPQDQLMKSI